MPTHSRGSQNAALERVGRSGSRYFEKGAGPVVLYGLAQGSPTGKLALLRKWTWTLTAPLRYLRHAFPRWPGDCDATDRHPDR
eukprot:1760530-Ditylum_brightwellii.AAC.1